MLYLDAMPVLAGATALLAPLYVLERGAVYPLDGEGVEEGSSAEGARVAVVDVHQQHTPSVPQRRVAPCVRGAVQGAHTSRAQQRLQGHDIMLPCVLCSVPGLVNGSVAKLSNR